MQLEQGKRHCQPPYSSMWVYHCVFLHVSGSYLYTLLSFDRIEQVIMQCFCKAAAAAQNQLNWFHQALDQRVRYAYAQQGLALQR